LYHQLTPGESAAKSLGSERSYATPRFALFAAGAGWALVTVRVTAGEVMDPLLATMDVDPGFAPVASPEVLMRATLELEEIQVTALVRVFVELPLYVPVAVNCTVAPLAMLVLVAAIAIDSSEGADGTVAPEDEVPCEL
jgi:hypothetical protein